MRKFVNKVQGPPVIGAANSNAISDAYRDSIEIAYQYIGNTIPSTKMKLYDGVILETPIMAGPIGLRGRGPKSGMAGYARSVNEAGSIYWADFHDPKSWYQLLSEGCRAIRVIKPLADNKRLLEEIQHDTEAGALGYAMDIDHGMTAYGEPDGQQEPFASKSADDLKLLVDASPLPFYLKGIVSVHDALLAKEAGAAGFIVSGHNNRFPCMVPPLKVLPKLRSAVGPEMKIFIDGGINNGYDAFKALALGADGVLCARSFAGAFIQNGEDGLTDKILEMTAELKGAMANTGSTDLAHINKDALVLPQG